MGFSVMEKLLSSASQELGKKALAITYIPREQIEKNNNNGYTIDSIEELAQDIKMGGLEQPIVVFQKENGTYCLLTGERRLTAIDSLAERGEWSGDIPCIVKDLDDYSLPLSEGTKEMYALLRTNYFNRKRTDADIYFEATQWRKIVQELKAAGYDEIIIGEDEGTGEKSVVSLKGRVREVVAKEIGVSTGQVKKIEDIEKNGSPKLKAAVKNNEVSIAAAAEIAALDKEGQDKLLNEKAGRKITAKEISTEKEKEISSKEDSKKRESTSEEKNNSDSGAEEHCDRCSYYSALDVPRKVDDECICGCCFKDYLSEHSAKPIFMPSCSWCENFEFSKEDIKWKIKE